MASHALKSLIILSQKVCGSKTQILVISLKKIARRQGDVSPILLVRIIRFIIIYVQNMD